MLDGIDSNIGISQLGNAHVLTVLWAIIQASQKGKWWIREAMGSVSLTALNATASPIPDSTHAVIAVKGH